MVRILIAVVLGIIVLLLLFQNRMIYHPRRYAAGEGVGNPLLVPISYTTAQGQQQAFYLRPKVLPDQPPRHLWVVFPGNGSVALDWVGFLDPPHDPRDGFLVIDYPPPARSRHPRKRLLHALRRLCMHSLLFSKPISTCFATRLVAPPA